MPTRHFLPLLLLFAAALAGCASPQYETRARLVLPADPAGLACVSGCAAQKASCQSACRTRYDACARAVEPEVESRYADALAQYENDLRAYAAALRHYALQMHFGWLDAGAVHRRHHPFWWDPFPAPRFPLAVREPVAPTREAVRATLLAARCQADCGCLPAYDDCAVGCGGRRLLETVCVANCPPAR